LSSSSFRSSARNGFYETRFRTYCFRTKFLAQSYWLYFN
jgi:hypothetical protein